MAEYVNPSVLVDTDWVAKNLDNPNVRIVESDEDILLYEVGHIPGAVMVDWHRDLNDPRFRDYIDVLIKVPRIVWSVMRMPPSS